MKYSKFWAYNIGASEARQISQTLLRVVIICTNFDSFNFTGSF